jgi:hypothetical protein
MKGIPKNRGGVTSKYLYYQETTSQIFADLTPLSLSVC